MSSQSQPAVSWRGLVHLFVVYIVWSSTYLAIRVAVRPGAGFPPFALAAIRCLLAFPLLLGWTKARGLRIRPTRDELRLLAISGVLLWAFGNAFVVVAEQRVSSALAAILVASTPIWVALLESLADKRMPSKLASLALLVGFAGVGLIGYPALRTGARAAAIAGRGAPPASVFKGRLGANGAGTCRGGSFLFFTEASWNWRLPPLGRSLPSPPEQCPRRVRHPR